MSRLRVAGLLVLALAVTGTVAAEGADASSQRGPQRVIVRLDDGAATAGIVREITGLGGAVAATFRHAVPAVVATVPAGVVERLVVDPRVAAVEPDAPVVAFQVPTGVARIGADEHAAADIDGDGTAIDVDIAVLDTGVDATHPDLAVAGGVDCRTGTCTPVDAPTDPHGHGTHVAGTAAARDDGVGVVGVAPGARIHSVQVLEEDGSGTTSTLLAGLEWLRTNADRIEVANLSLGCECASTAVNEAVRAVTQAGVTVVVAAGNAATDAGAYSPANHPDVLAVGAMSDYDGAPGRLGGAGCIPDVDDSFASYSNYGSVVDVVAPGSCIRSTLPGSRYGRSTGTSMAAPHVAGTAALYVATAAVPPSSTRAEQVRRAVVERFAVAATDDCGYTDSVSIAPMLHLTCVGIVANADPVLEITSPQDGTTVTSGQSVALRATAYDAEDADLSRDLVWTSSVAGRLGTGPSLDVTLTQVGDHTITASVTDSSGANVRRSRLVRVTTASGSSGGTSGPPPSVPEEPEPAAPPSTDNLPRLTVVAPLPEAQLLAGRTTQLVSEALDVEDGDIRALVRWRSDRDGGLGEGGTVGAALSSGPHRITASVIDANGNLVERTTSVTVGDPERLGSRSIAGACPPDRVPEGRFRDVGDDDPHADAIDCVAWWGIASGTGSGNYQPTGLVTRAQMATFVAETIRRSGGSLPDAGSDHFDDDDGSVHEDNINRLVEAGVVKGITRGRYGPGEPVTREQMATFLARTYERRSALPLPGIQDRFEDVDSVHEPNVDAVAAAGIAAGVEPRRYEPAAVVRRDQMASFVARLLDALVDMNVTAPPS